MSARVDFLVVGSGFAGAATAYHLSRRSEASILMVEQEKTPGVHASGRNASLLLESVAEPSVRRAAAASQRAYRRHRAEVGFDQVGSILLGTRAQLEAVREPDLVESRFLAPAEVAARVPPVAGHPFEAALETPGDGVLDTWALLNFYLDGARGRGAEIRYDCEVLAVSDGPPFLVKTTRGDVEAGCLVNGGGAWAGEIARRSGFEAPAPLVAKKRHLFLLDGVAPIDTSWPFVWNLDLGWYFRPESGGLLFSLCDEELSDVFEETVSPGIEERLADFIFTRRLPRFEGAEIRKVWSCFRTAAPDVSFVIGWDPRREGFFWVAGLWGHGMGCSWEVGRLAAEGLSTGRNPSPVFDPARFDG